MTTIVHEDKKNLARAASVLQQSGVVVYPTEGVFGIGCLPIYKDAIKRILAIKQRSAAQGLILIAANWQQLSPYIGTCEKKYTDKILENQSLIITWVVPAVNNIEKLLTGDHATIAIRITSHKLAKALCMLAGSAIISTSANYHNMPPCVTYDEAYEVFANTVDYVLPGKVDNPGRVSQICDVVTGAMLR